MKSEYYIHNALIQLISFNYRVSLSVWGSFFFFLFVFFPAKKILGSGKSSLPPPTTLVMLVLAPFEPSVVYEKLVDCPPSPLRGGYSSPRFVSENGSQGHSLL